jgi:hypothetical protein
MLVKRNNIKKNISQVQTTIVLGSNGRFEKTFVLSTCFLCLKND